MESLQALVQACDQIVKQPLATQEASAQLFFEQHPLEAVFRALSAQDVTEQQLDTVCSALGSVLSTSYGASLLPSARSYAEAALQSPQHKLRLLGCEQLGRLLLVTADEQQQRQLEKTLVESLQDTDTGVAAVAEKALVAHVAGRPDSFTGLLNGGSPAGQALQEMLESSSAMQRMRAFALLTAAAASSSSNAQQLKQSGAVTQLLQQLDPADPLACLVALQLLQELVVFTGGSAARLMQQLLLPSLLELLADPSTAPGAFPIAARLVAAAAAEEAAAGVSSNGAAAMEVDGVAHSNGNGVADYAYAGDAAGALLMKMQEVLDDRGSASSDMEVVALDAACQLALPSSTSAALLASPANPQLLQSICTRAFGRTASPPVRLAALHAFASIAGVERAGEARDRSAALMAAANEDALRVAVFEAVAGAAGGVGAARSPAEAVLNLLQQPFDDTRTGVYRCGSALALRPWFAADVCNSSALLARLCRTDSESGQQACEWRHSTVMALWATVQYVLALPDGAREASYKQQLPPAVQQQLVTAVRGGPYGVTGGRATQQSHFVATVPR